MARFILARLVLCVFVLLAAVGGPPAIAQSASDALKDAERSHRHGDFATARKRFEALAKSGVVQAQAALGQMLLSGEGGPVDAGKAAQWLRRAASGRPKPWGDSLPVEALTTLAKMYEHGDGVVADAEAAARYRYRAADRFGHSDPLRRKADAGSAPDQFWYAEYLLTKNPEDQSVPLRYFAKAARAGHVGAAAALGALYAFVDETPKAKRWLTAALAAGHTRAGLYLAGLEEPAERLARYVAAAESGSSAAVQVLTQRYEPGDFPPDQAEMIWGRAIASGDLEAAYEWQRHQDVLAGGPADAAAALAEYRRRGDAGDPDANAMVAAMLVFGRQAAATSSEAIQRTTAAAEAGHAIAAYALGRAFDNANGADHDPEAATQWFKRALDAGYGPAAGWLGANLQFDDEVGLEGRIQAMDLLVRAAQLGDLSSLDALRDEVEDGFGYAEFAYGQFLVAKGPEKEAARLIRLAAEYGVPDAMIAHVENLRAAGDVEGAADWFVRVADTDDGGAVRTVAEMLEANRDAWPEVANMYTRAAVLGDETATQLLAELAKKGSREAVFNLGWILLQEEPAPYRVEEGAEMISLAAKAGEPRAMAQLANLYDAGHGVRKDRREALAWRHRAAEAGEEAAQLALVLDYSDDASPLLDLAKAAKWARRAAEAGSADGAFALANVIDRAGRKAGTPAEVMKYLTVAATAGNPLAQRALGVAYAEGNAVEQDFAVAANWLLRAALQDDVEAVYQFGKVMLARPDGDLKSNAERALFAFKQAADDGHAEAAFQAGEELWDGDRVAEDTEKAIEWYGKAADAAHVGAQSALGVIYELGQAVEPDLPKAAAYYEKAAAAGDAVAQNNLAGFYRHGKGGVGQDLRKAVALLKRSAAQENAVGQFSLAAMYYNGVGVDKDLAEARRLFRRSAEGGDVDGQWAIASLLRRGEGGPADPDGARRWYEAGALQGHTGAAFALAEMHAAGEGGPPDAPAALAWALRADIAADYKARALAGKLASVLDADGHDAARLAAAPNLSVREIADVTRFFVSGEFDVHPQEAVFWAELAAIQGHLGAQVFAAEAYETGDGVPKDFEKAAVWRLLAANQGDGESAMIAGRMYETGEGLAKDVDLAAEMYETAVYDGQDGAMAALQALDAAGAPAAAYSLAVLTEGGVGVEADLGKAVALYRKAARAGHPAAQNDLGTLYESGEGVAKSDAEAAKWYRRSAENGHPIGANNLGALMLEGRGVERDLASAVEWFRKSAEGGAALGQYNYARMLGRGDGVAQDMSAAYYWLRRLDGRDDLPEDISSNLWLLRAALRMALTENEMAAVDARILAEDQAAKR